VAESKGYFQRHGLTARRPFKVLS